MSFQKTCHWFVSIPHSGEEIPPQTPWLSRLPEAILMDDVDRYVDRLYDPVLQERGVPSVRTRWHRYAVDLNRLPEDVDQSSVAGSPSPPGTHPRGFHWVMTTHQDQLLPQPFSDQDHKDLRDLIYEPFHKNIKDLSLELKQKNKYINGEEKIFHLDLHSMPSLGTSMHRDPGELRADVVVSDSLGRSASAKFLETVVMAYLRSGFKVAYNWPYFGGRLTEQYGRPDLGHETIQVELNRALYMDEKTKKWIPEKAEVVQKKLREAILRIDKALSCEEVPS